MLGGSGIHESFRCGMELFLVPKTRCVKHILFCVLFCLGSERLIVDGNVG